jgi:hypothetical protein
VHAAEEHGHGERRGLALGDRAIGDAAHEGRDLVRRERPAVALRADDLLRQQARHQ